MVTKLGAMSLTGHRDCYCSPVSGDKLSSRVLCASQKQEGTGRGRRWRHCWGGADKSVQPVPVRSGVPDGGLKSDDDLSM